MCRLLIVGPRARTQMTCDAGDGFWSSLFDFHVIVTIPPLLREVCDSPGQAANCHIHGPYTCGFISNLAHLKIRKLIYCVPWNDVYWQVKFPAFYESWSFISLPFSGKTVTKPHHLCHVSQTVSLPADFPSKILYVYLMSAVPPTFPSSATWKEDRSVGARVILKQSLMKNGLRVWAELIWLRMRSSGQAFVKTVMKLWCP
jgi:hypothetical protein